MINDLVSQASLVSREDSTVYCGNFIYENSSWTKVLIPNGYITKNKSSQPVYHYYIKDHLGSNRVVVNESGNMVQAVEYYPSGIPVSKNDFKDNYLHTGKELEGMHGLHWYDNNKRMYDPILCRFTTMDPLCEKYYDTSPYAHCGNNPVNNIDLNGDSIWFSYQRDKDNQLTGVTMHVTGKVLDISNNHVDLNDATNTISNSIQSSFKGNVKGVSFTTEVNLEGAKDMSGVSDRDHLFVLTEINNGNVMGAANDYGGKVAFLDADYFSGIWDTTIGTTGGTIAAHEFGHLLGLKHMSTTSENLMYDYPAGKFFGNGGKISSDQLRFIHNEKIINKGSNYEMFLGKRLPNRGYVKHYIKM